MTTGERIYIAFAIAIWPMIIPLIISSGHFSTRIIILNIVIFIIFVALIFFCYKPERKDINGKSW